MYGGLPTGERDRWVKTTPTNPVILSPSAAWEGGASGALVEPSVLPPSLSPDGNWWLYYRGGWTGVVKIGLATCPVGSDPAVAANWTKAGGNPIFGGLGGSLADQFHVIPTGKIAGTYYAIYNAGTGTTNVFRYATSTDGLAWTDGGQALAPTNSNWWWNAGTPIPGNPHVFFDSGGSLYHLFFEGWTGAGGWRQGHATSANPQGPYSEVGFTNPIASLVIPGGTSSVTGAMVQLIGSTYHMWLQFQPAGVTPSKICRFTSASLNGPWAMYGSWPVIGITETAALTLPDQVADPDIWEVSGSSYCFYDVDDNTNSAGKICLATFAGTLAQLVA